MEKLNYLSARVREQIADRFLFVRSFPRDVNGRTVRASARQSNYEHRMMAFVSAYLEATRDFKIVVSPGTNN